MTEPAPALSPASIVVAAPGQVSTELEGEAVILGLADGVYYGLDGVGAMVWSRLDQPRSVAELRDAVTAEFAVDAETAERDLLTLLRELAERRLVEVVGPV